MKTRTLAATAAATLFFAVGAQLQATEIPVLSNLSLPSASEPRVGKVGNPKNTVLRAQKESTAEGGASLADNPIVGLFAGLGDAVGSAASSINIDNSGADRDYTINGFSAKNGTVRRR